LTQRAIALHERLTGVVLGGGSTDDVIAALAQVVPGRIELASPGADVAAGRDAHRTVVPVMAGDDRLGSLIAVTDTSPTAADVRLLERSASTIALVLLSERAVMEAHSRSRNELLDALLSNPGDRDMEARLRGAGVDVARSHVVAVIEPTPNTKHEARSLAEGMAGVGLAGEHQGAFVALIAGDDVSKVVDAVRSRGESVGTIAVAGPTTGTAEIAACYDEARRGVRLLAALDRRGAVASVDELGPFRYLFDRAGAGDASRFVETAIGALLEHDRLRRGDLVATLEAYFANAQQHAATASTLGIHANTLYQRLARIGDLLGDDWRARSLELHLALRLNDVSARITPHA
jgi:sugar diacid utilization regulator